MKKTGDPKIDNFRLYYLDRAQYVGKYKLPRLKPTQFVPERVISFNERKSAKDKEKTWVDFFIDDIHFENFWRHPEVSFDNLRKFAGIITPDYSMYPDLLPGNNIWNCTRNRVMAYYLQQNGFNIVPVASWCSADDFDWCFDGLPEKASIAISTNGCVSHEYGRRMFLQGVEELQKQKEPSHLIVCGREIKDLERYSNITYYPSFSQRWKERAKNGK